MHQHANHGHEDNGHGHHGTHVHLHDAAVAGDVDRRRFLAALLVLLTFLAVQIAGGVIFNSLALLSDSVHMLGDATAVALALAAARLAARPVSATRTYGLGRAELLAALINGATLVGAAAWIIIEGIRRLGDTPDVVGGGVVAVAAAGLVANGAVAWLLAGSATENINAQAAMQHALVDAASSVAVIAGGLVILAGGPAWVDTVMALGIGVVAALGGVRTLRRSADLLMDATPPGIDLDEMRAVLATCAAVVEVHDLHVWSIGARRNALTAHVVVGAEADVAAVVRECAGELRRQVGIDHITLQVVPQEGGGPVPVEPRVDRAEVERRRNAADPGPPGTTGSTPADD